MDGKTVDFTSYKNLVLSITDQKYVSEICLLQGISLILFSLFD